MKQGKTNTKIAGVDVDKRRLHVAICGMADTLVVDNTDVGVSELIAWLRAREVGRVGMEATGVYGRLLNDAADAAGLEVVVHQPLEVRRFAQFKRLRAKNDKLDAALIALATAQVEAVKAASDRRLRELGDRLTAYEEVSDQIARMRGFLEHAALADIVTAFKAQIQSLEKLKAKLIGQILTFIKSHPDLARRHKLLLSLPGFGPVVAATCVARMPELGTMTASQAASLLGVAPFDRDSGLHKGKRMIAGGRGRPRRMVYLAALAAKRCDPALRAHAQQLLARGKPKKVAIVAVMRKLIEAANLVLARDTPWERRQPTPA